MMIATWRLALLAAPPFATALIIAGLTLIPPTIARAQPPAYPSTAATQRYEPRSVGQRNSMGEIKAAAQFVPAQISPVPNTPVPDVPVPNTPVPNTPVPNTPVPNTPVPLPPPQEPVEGLSPQGLVMPEERPITSLSAAIQPKATNRVPPDFARAHFGSSLVNGDSRPWHDTLYFWEPPSVCHRPLYFEEANLERYGYGAHPILQPAVSGARFLATTAALPYLMTAQSPRDCVYTLGRDRPGSLVPRRPHYPELRPGAVTAEAGVAAGLILLIP